MVQDRPAECAHSSCMINSNMVSSVRETLTRVVMVAVFVEFMAFASRMILHIDLSDFVKILVMSSESENGKSRLLNSVGN